MKKIAYVFWATVGMIVLAFVMSVYTAIQKRNAEKSLDPSTIPVPALPVPGVPQPKEPPSIPTPAEQSR